jgi:hypothetical protein
VWEKEQLEVMQRREMRPTARVTVDTVYDYNPLDATGIITRQASPDFSTARELRNSRFLSHVKLFDFNMHLTTFEYEPVGLVLDGGDFFDCHAPWEFDVAGRR